MNAYAVQQRQQQHTHQFPAPPIIAQNDLYDTTGMKMELFPDEFQQQVRSTFAYIPQRAYSEQELAESLGWIDYSNANQHNNSPAQAMQMTNNTSIQQANFTHEQPQPQPPPNACLPQSGSYQGNGHFGSLPIPQTPQSPANGWHSSFESPSFRTDSRAMHVRKVSLSNQINSGDTDKNGFVNVDKKAMRRYSHNAGKSYNN